MHRWNIDAGLFSKKDTIILFMHAVSEMRRLWLALGLLAALPLISPAHAACDAPRDEDERGRCLEADLRASDTRINDLYQRLMAFLDESEKRDLRVAQVAWLKNRTATCKLDDRESDREKWFRSILDDPAKTVCVVRLTGERNDALERRVARYAAPASPSPTPVPQPAPIARAAPTPIAPTDGPRPPAAAAGPAPRFTFVVHTSEYDRRSAKFHNKGKWYYELRVNIGEIARRTDSLLFVGASTPDGYTHGFRISARRWDRERPEAVIGIALDLDEGKIYQRYNGNWPGGEPGSNRGVDVKLGRAYSGLITSSVSLRELEQAQLIDANFGSAPFVYSIPNGYRAYGEQE